ncbi:YecR-like lipofamily protein [Shewanella violacea]|uniref:Lipoprotein n=1 Tax=Shewanella violacea (strain JCM 10179 / CIP 106290 / LMG 19151 / DSS12) TaxID=637905 RepID=D4ZHY8_SHEVD|nr:YecR-like lipofamily protein [Shewanella violacea]BAJ01287.1 conserved hypothetical protein [Shewanella violacea DSS12]
MNKQLKKTLVIAIIALTMSACTSMKTMEATGGSLADGIIELSYTYNQYETSQFDEQDALKTASKRCKAWGFKKADPFSGERISCRDKIGSRCDVYLVTKKYQCIGKS